MIDVYFSPKKFGLEKVAEIEWDKEPYQFNMTVVWKEVKTGRMFFASDSGCSCPSPFVSYKKIEDLIPLDSISQITYMIKKYHEDKIERDWYTGVTVAETDAFLNDILKAMSLFGGD